MLSGLSSLFLFSLWRIDGRKMKAGPAASALRGAEGQNGLWLLCVPRGGGWGVGEGSS